jgi:hypothetical protein
MRNRRIDIQCVSNVFGGLEKQKLYAEVAQQKVRGRIVRSNAPVRTMAGKPLIFGASRISSISMIIHIRMSIFIFATPRRMLNEIR